MKSRYRWFVVFVFFAFMLLHQADKLLIGPLTTPIMETFGIDEATARNADALLDIDMNAVRKRCRRCPSPETCARYLNGETVPGNDFCPNAPQFAAVVQARQCRLRYDPGHRPGRRLDG